MHMSTQTAVHVPEWTFGDRIRKIRRDARLSQGEFAELIGRGDKAVAAWESGKNEPGDIVAVARRIQVALGVRAEWTLGLIDGGHTPGGGPDSGNTQDGSFTISYAKSARLIPFPAASLAGAA